MRMLDVCSGLGGASQPMYDNGWEILRLENNQLLKDVPNTALVDIMEVPLSHLACETPIDLVWCSPPCREFSTGYASPRSKAARAGEIWEPNMDLVHRCIEIIDYCQPRYWVIENVRGAIKYFADSLGEPRQILGAFVLWGNFPLIDLPRSFVHSKAMNDKTSSDPLRSNWKALIPYPLADSLRMAIENQQTILSYV